jgi:hypothetical protein
MDRAISLRTKRRAYAATNASSNLSRNQCKNRSRFPISVRKHRTRCQDRMMRPREAKAFTLLNPSHVSERFYVVHPLDRSPRKITCEFRAARSDEEDAVLQNPGGSRSIRFGEHTRLLRIANLEPREAKPLYADSSCASAANPSSSSGVPLTP